MIGHKKRGGGTNPMIRAERIRSKVLGINITDTYGTCA